MTGKPLGITGEYGEYIAARELELKLGGVRMAGYDVTDTAGCRIQIKARSIPRDKQLVGQRLGSIRLDHEWDVVLMIILGPSSNDLQKDLFEKYLESRNSGDRDKDGDWASLET